MVGLRWLLLCFFIRYLMMVLDFVIMVLLLVIIGDLFNGCIWCSEFGVSMVFGLCL